MFELTAEFRARLSAAMSFDDIMNLQGKVFRNVEGRRTLRFELKGAGYFVKTHSGVGWKEIFKNLSQGKWPVLGAANEFNAIHKLEELELATMSIAGFGERGANPATKQSFLITDELVNTISLEDFCAEWVNQKPTFALKLALIKKVAGIARELHENGVNHRDFYLCHFLLDQTKFEQGDLILYLIDLHRAQVRSKTPRRWLIKDLSGLYFSAMGIGLTQQDALRFIKYYRGKALREVLSQEQFFWEKIKIKAENLYASYVLRYGLQGDLTK